VIWSIPDNPSWAPTDRRIDRGGPVIESRRSTVRNVMAIMLILAGVLVLAPTGAAADSRDLDDERLAIGRALIEVQSDNWPSILPYYTDDIEYHDPIVDIFGLATMGEFLGRLFASSPDLVTTIEDETLRDGVYVATWEMVGQFAGVPYSAKGISIIKFRDDTLQVYYQRDYYTENDIMINIPGLDEAAIGFRTFYRCAVDPTFDCPLGEPAVDLARRSWPEGDQYQMVNDLYQWQLNVARALVEIDASNYESLLHLYSQDIAYRDPIVTIDGIRTMSEFLGLLFDSSPDLVTTIEDETLVDGIYAATWTMVGQFDGVPFNAKGMSLVKFQPGSHEVSYSRDYYTEGDIMINIPGLDEAVAGFRHFYRCAVDPTYDCPPDPAALTDALDRPSVQPAPTFVLEQNAPNPFNPATEISFVVPAGGAGLTLRVYDVSGNLVRTLVDGFQPAGPHTVSWHGRNDQGGPVASGTYFYQLTAPTFSEIRKMVLLK
jgi:hypothetical protein